MQVLPVWVQTACAALVGLCAAGGPVRSCVLPLTGERLALVAA